MLVNLYVYPSLLINVDTLIHYFSLHFYMFSNVIVYSFISYSIIYDFASLFS